MKLTFYVLTNDFVVNANSQYDKEYSVTQECSLLAFVCQLVTTILAKSNKQLIIFDDNTERMRALDKQLWVFSQTSFIAHDLYISDESNQHTIEKMSTTTPVIIANTLADNFCTHFDGVVLNLSTTAIKIVDNVDENSNIENSINGFQCLDALLEIIPADVKNKEIGRAKYAEYKESGFDITVHKINNRL